MNTQFLITGWLIWWVAAAKQLLNLKKKKKNTHTHTHTRRYLTWPSGFEKGHRRRRDKGSVRNQRLSFSLNPWTSIPQELHTFNLKSAINSNLTVSVTSIEYQSPEKRRSELLAALKCHQKLHNCSGAKVDWENALRSLWRLWVLIEAFNRVIMITALEPYWCCPSALLNLRVAL